ncbi:MAG: CPBP family intramembrane metalloprotease [Clostridiales bacterium]|nr:CPBP family intramembrane metalloprotease [Clostridiales bacterium]
MRKIGSFFKSILVFIVAYLLQIVVVAGMVIYAILADGGGISGLVGKVFGVFGGTYSVSYNSQLTNLIYGVLGLLIFVVWYHRALVRPYKKKKGSYPRGYSFHTIMSILFLGIGLQYVTTLVANVTAYFKPDWLSAYQKLVSNAGYGNPTVTIVIYSIVVAPILEETIFRGLIFRYARIAFPFWIANIWQALLFGVMHGNFLQGIYAFVMGLILGFIAHRGRGIKYSIPVHIIFNVIGLFFSGLISLTTSLSYPIAMAAGMALTIFALWLFYTDFDTDGTRRRRHR